MIAAIYARKSTDQSGVVDEQKSVKRQIERATDYAQRKGWTVDPNHIFVDDGISGAEFANRPAFVRLMNALKPRPPFQALVMSEESRLGREQLEVGYALKQLVSAGVRVFCYLSDSERTLNGPIEKAMLALQTMADEMEREKARQRTYDAMLRKAKAGHVTGGRVFGYDNIDVRGRDGKRDHVVRRINESEAAVVRRIFELSAAGRGAKSIAKILNADRALSPAAQQGRPAGWCPTSVRAVLRRPLYHGEIVWNQTRKRDQWGQQHQTDRPAGEHVRIAAPELRIVPDALWADVQARLVAARRDYTNQTGGRTWGRPVDGTVSRYLLTGLASCGVCGAGLIAHTRSHGRQRKAFYVCSAFQHKGRTICGNNQALPLALVDREVLAAFREDLLNPAVIDRACAKVVSRLQQQPTIAATRGSAIAEELARLNTELARLAEALAGGADLASVREALTAREARRDQLREELATLQATRRRGGVDQISRVLPELRRRLRDWRSVLAAETHQARQMLRTLLQGRITFTPRPDVQGVEISGRGDLGQLFAGVLPQLLASPTGQRERYPDLPLSGRTRRRAA